MKTFSTLFLATILTLQAEPGFYSLGTISGDGAREWNINGILDNHGMGHGAIVDMSSNLFLSDTLQETGEIVLKEDGTLTANWSHKIEITYNYQPDFYQPSDVWDEFGDDGTNRFDFDEQFFWNLDFGIYSMANNPNPVNKLVVTLSTEATGTWSGSGSLNLNFDCLVDSSSTITYLPPKTTEIVTETIPGTDLPVSFSTTGSCSNGSIDFKWDTLEVWLPALRDAYYTGDKEVVVADALREEIIELEAQNTDDYINLEVKGWSYEDTMIQGSPLDGELQAKYVQYYLVDVDAPYGFYVLGDYGEAPGTQEARFIYGGQQVTRSLESGYAEDGQLSYGDPSDFVEVEILSDGAVTETLDLPLIKVPVSPWAGSAGDFSASPGVIYTGKPINWPISLAATDTISDISFLTGIWGITGSASSQFDVGADSTGAPVNGALVTTLQFSTPKRTQSLSLTGSHQTTLGINGLTATGDFSTSPVSANLTQQVSLLDVIPGAGAVLGKFGRIISGGVGLTIEGSLTGQASGSYAAMPGDSNPRFTSGTLTANADLKATINTVPKFARGVINLAISGGGGVVVVINLAPTPSVSSLNGYANFGLKVKFFKLVDEELEKEWGEKPDFSPPPSSSQFLSTLSSSQAAPDVPAEDQLPAQGDIDLVRTSNGAFIVNSGDHSTLPAPASEITFRQADRYWDRWETTLIPDESGKSNFAPTVVPATNNINLDRTWIPNLNNGLIVWAQADGPVPASSDDYAAYMNSSDLKFRYFTDSFFFSIHSEERTLTDNTLADFGPELIVGSDDGQARLFWVRGDGLDLTGHTTALQILTRNWIAYDPGASESDPSTAFSAETVALSGLHNILDWRVTAWDSQNAAIGCVVDTDGDSATDTDREIYLVRQVNGTWEAPVRITDNALCDDCPVLLFEDVNHLVLSWREDGQVVGTMDYDASSAPMLWFGSDSRAVPSWHLAQLVYRSSEDSLVAVWPEDTGIGYTEEALGTHLPGAAFPASKYRELGGAVSNLDVFKSTTSDQFLQVTAVTEHATEADINSVPTTLPACIHQVGLTVGEAARKLTVVSADSSNPRPSMGDSVVLNIEATSLNPIAYTWSFNGRALAGKTSPSLTLSSLGLQDDGFYTVTANDGVDSVSRTFTINSLEPFADWMARVHPSETLLNDEFDDPDGDGAPNKLEYFFGTDPGDSHELPGMISQPRPESSSFVIDLNLNSKAVDCPYRIEYTSDMSIWHDATELFTPIKMVPGLTRLTFQSPTDPEAGNAWLLYDIDAEPSTSGYYRLRLD